MLVDRRWIDVPSREIQYLALLGDDGATGIKHWCGAAYETSGVEISVPYVTHCAILPPRLHLLRSTRCNSKSPCMELTEAS
jgi:hypothetical protein